MINANIETATATPAAVAVLIERKPLIEALAFLSKFVCEARGSIPQVGAVRISAAGDGVRLYACDLDLAAYTDISGAWDVPGELVADAKALLAAVKACDGDTVKLQVEGAAVLVSGDSVAGRVPAVKGDMPMLRDPVEPVAMTLDAGELRADWARLTPCISSEETRYYLNGVFMHAVTLGKGDDAPRVLRMAATDGHRMGRIERPLRLADGVTLDGAIMPRKTVAAVLGALGKKPDGVAAFAIGKDKAIITVGGWAFTSKLIDGQFPDYVRVIPSADNVPLHASFAPGDLGKAVAPLAKVRAAVKVSLSGEGATFETQGGDGAALATGAAVAWHDHSKPQATGAKPFAVGMNGKYLHDMAGMFAGCESVTIKIADAAAPMRFESTDAPEFVAVLMPMRVEGATPAPAAKPAKPSEPILTPFQVFERDYRAAFEARDGAGMREAVAAYRDALNLPQPERTHDQIAMTAARVRAMALATAGEGETLAQAKRRGARAAKHWTQQRRAVCRDKALSRTWGGGTFKAMGERYARQVAFAAERDELVAMLEGETRDVVPVELRSGKKVFLLACELRDAHRRTYTTVKADGGTGRSRRASYAYLSDIVRIVTPRARRATPAPVSDTSALESTVAALIERVAAMEATIAAQASELATRAAVNETPEPVVAAGDPVDTRDAYIASLLAEREALRERADAAEGERDAAVAALGAAQGRGKDARARIARRLLSARAGRRTALREARGMQAGLAQAQGELAKLQPIAAMIAAMAPVAPAPSGENVVAIRAA